MSDNLGQPSFASPTIQEAVAEVEREAVHQLPNNHIRLSSGVVLRTKKVSVLRIQAVANKIKPPKLEDYAFYDPDREETILNPNHPEYLAAVERHNTEVGMAVLDALIVFGTEPVEVPDTVHPLESDAWLEELDFVGIEVNRESKLARYLAWVRYVAMVTEEDVSLVTQKISSSTMGSSEELVAQAIENFPNKS